MLKTVSKLFIVVMFLGLCQSSFASDDKAVDAARDRMRKVLAEAVEHKRNGDIGENNKGFLTARVDDAKVKALVNQINKDRVILYKAVAKKVGKSPVTVAKYRAQMIAKKAKAGEYIQNSNGKWEKR